MRGTILSKDEKEFLNMSVDEYTRANLQRIEKLRTQGKVWDFPSGLSIIKYKQYKEYLVIETRYGFMMGFPSKTLSEAKNKINDPKYIRSMLDFHGIPSLNPSVFKKINQQIYDDLKNQILSLKKYEGKVYRGINKIPNKKILDLGAGGLPDFRATDAIDLSTTGQKFSGIAYISGIDLNCSKLPYPDNYFDGELSYGALFFNFGTVKTYNEIYRTLKPGGYLEVGLRSLEDMGIKMRKNAMKNMGLVNIHVEQYTDYSKDPLERIIGTKPE